MLAPLALAAGCVLLSLALFDGGTGSVWVVVVVLLSFAGLGLSGVGVSWLLDPPEAPGVPDSGSGAPGVYRLISAPSRAVAPLSFTTVSPRSMRSRDRYHGFLVKRQFASHDTVAEHQDGCAKAVTHG